LPSPEYEALMKALAAGVLHPTDTFEEARSKLESLHGHPIEASTRVEQVALGGVPCAFVETPGSAKSGALVVLHHGGAYVAAGGDGYLFYAEMLADHLGSPVLLIDYRLAPAHPHPAALEDCVAAYRGLLESGRDPSRVGFIGDSCGGALALASLLCLRDQGAALPACAVTLGGWFDLEAKGRSATHPTGPDPFAHRDFTRARGRDYVGPNGALDDPLVSPVNAELHDLPPLLLQVGQVDLTRDDAFALGARAAEVGVAVELEVVPGMVHGFQGLARMGIPEAGAALDRAGEFFRRHTGAGASDSQPNGGG